jgi:mRNA interferase MazF
MEIKQGDIFWVQLDEPVGSEPGFLHPYVIIQNNLFNRSRLNTVVACVLTSNVSLANAPGNVLLRKGEACLPKSSVANITQLITLNKADLQRKIGTLSNKRIIEILDGIKLLIEPRDIVLK